MKIKLSAQRQVLCLGLAFFLALGQPSEGYGDQERRISFTELTHYTMGLIYDAYGMSEEAVSEYKQVLQYNPESYHTRLKLGTNYARLGLLQEAVDELRLASTLNPEDLQARYLLALIYSTRKEFDLAAAEYEFILKSFTKSDPQNIEVFGYLGQLYYSQKKYEKALEQFEKMLEIEPKNADVMYVLGSLYLEVDKKQKAVEMFSQSIAIDPFHDGSLNSLGYLFAEDGTRLDEALDYVQRAVKIDPENGAYLDSLGWVYFKKQMYSEALDYLRQADEKLKDPTICNHIAEVYFALNKFEDARNYWQLSLELLPDQADIAEKLKQLPARSAKQRK